MSETTLNDRMKEDAMKRLPKRLLYLLRYGAVKEGVDVDDNGYVAIADAMKVPLLSVYSQDEILNEVKSSVSYRNMPRYEWKEKDKTIYIRAAYLRRFEPNPYQAGTKVKTLSETSMMCVLDNLDQFDLEDFQDEYTIKRMIHRLKRRKAITNKALSVLFIPTITRIDLEGIYLTNNTLRLLWTQCPHLKGVNLKNCGYILTDTVLTQLAKNLPSLEQLNLSRCSHLTDKCLAILSKRLHHLKVLHIAGVPSINPKCVRTFLDSTKELTFLDVFYMKTNQEEFDSLMKQAEGRGVKLVLHSPKVKLLEKKSSFEDGDDEKHNGDENVEDDDYYSDGYDNEEESDLEM